MKTMKFESKLIENIESKASRESELSYEKVAQILKGSFC
jgi:hypothetical protein